MKGARATEVEEPEESFKSLGGGSSDWRVELAWTLPSKAEVVVQSIGEPNCDGNQEDVRVHWAWDEVTSLRRRSRWQGPQQQA